MAQSLTSFQRLHIINTFKIVKSIRETSILCKASRNTVRKILRIQGLSVSLKNEMLVHGRSNRAIRTIPAINPDCGWNPLTSSLYMALHRFEFSRPVEPGIVENISNISLLMQHLGRELKIGSSTLGTLKLELLMRSYINFCDSEARASGFASDISMSKEKQAKIHLQYKMASERSLATVFEIINDLEGKSALRSLKLQQNNININMPGN